MPEKHYPSAYDWDFSQYCKSPGIITERSLKHPKWGQGIRVSGRARICAIGYNYSSTFTTPGTILDPPGFGYHNKDVGYLQFNPHCTHSQRLRNFANSFARYAFRSIRLVYVPRCASTQVGYHALALYADGGVPGKPADYLIDFDAILEMEGALSGGFRFPMASTVVYNGDDSWMTNVDYDNQAAARQSSQYTFLAVTPDTTTASVTLGQLFMDYVVDFYQPSGLATYVGLTTPNIQACGAIAPQPTLVKGAKVAVDDIDPPPPEKPPAALRGPRRE